MKKPNNQWLYAIVIFVTGVIGNDVAKSAPNVKPQSEFRNGFFLRGLTELYLPQHMILKQQNANGGFNQTQLSSDKGGGLGIDVGYQWRGAEFGLSYLFLKIFAAVTAETGANLWRSGNQVFHIDNHMVLFNLGYGFGADSGFYQLGDFTIYLGSGLGFNIIRAARLGGEEFAADKFVIPATVAVAWRLNEFFKIAIYSKYYWQADGVYGGVGQYSAKTPFAANINNQPVQLPVQLLDAGGFAFGARLDFNF